MAEPPRIPTRLDYTRRLYDNVLDWYKSADRKAQIILTLDGVFLSFLTSSMFQSRSDLDTLMANFSLPVQLLLGAMILTLVASIISAVFCLRSRTLSEKALRETFLDHQVSLDDPATYSPAVMWFFQLLWRLQPDQLQNRLVEAVDDEFEIRALGAQIHILSRNVTEKHAWINRGFQGAAASLILFLTAGVIHVLSA